MTAEQKAEMLAVIDAAESEIAGLLDEAEAEVARERQLKDSARAHWTEAQDRLAEIERMLIGITGEQCGIVANIGILQGSLLNLREANQEGKRALSDRDAEIARLRGVIEKAPHDECCSSLDALGDDPLPLCDCWKAKARLANP